MLQVTVARFQEQWPGCRITVLSLPNVDAGRFVEGVASVDVNCVTLAFRLFGRFSAVFGAVDSALVTRYPFLIRGAALKQRLRGRSSASLTTFSRALAEADIVAASGGGYLNDEFPAMVEWTAWLLLAAQSLGKRTALFGQGLGPLNDSRLRRLLGRALDKVEAIGLREGVYGPSLARELGVASHRCIVTGDDALDLALRKASAELGKKLGVNLRRAWFAGIADDVEVRISQAIAKLTAELNAVPLVIPIATDHADAVVGARMTGQISPNAVVLRVLDVIRLVSECRVVLTGSYHAGVFALGQGIPVVGIVGSDYYRQKFLGLAAQFPKGCLVADAHSPTFEVDLTNGVLLLWKEAEALRPALLLAAKSQIESAQSLYQKFANRSCTATY